jgi:hypothetical protein
MPDESVMEACTTIETTTEKVRELCQDKQTCSINASNGSKIFVPDPCPRFLKQLRVWYQCVKQPGNYLKNNFFPKALVIFFSIKIFKF